jgi:hypothetical protein
MINRDAGLDLLELKLSKPAEYLRQIRAVDKEKIELAANRIIEEYLSDSQRLQALIQNQVEKSLTDSIESAIRRVFDQDDMRELIKNRVQADVRNAVKNALRKTLERKL